MSKPRLLAIGLLMLAAAARADIIILKNGSVYRGKVVGTNSTGVEFQRSRFKIPYPSQQIRDLYLESEADSALTNSPGLEKVNGKAPHQLLDWGQAIVRLANQPWATDIRQIPSAVIEAGVFRRVPYTSFRCAQGVYELDVYGDPQRPAGFEIGVSKKYSGQDPPRDNCVAFALSVLTDETLQNALQSLGKYEGKVQTNGVTISITPPTGPYAEGGWWVSVYIESLVDSARASEAELKLVSIPTANVATSSSSSQSGEVPWTAEDLNTVRLRSSDAGASGGGGRVFVRSYTRKDGTYVRGYSRSSPRR